MEGAGFMADELPSVFCSAANNPSSYTAVDYMAMMAHLWAAVRALDERLRSLCDERAAAEGKEKDNNTEQQQLPRRRRQSC
jgi:hypothetical protein